MSLLFIFIIIVANLRIFCLLCLCTRVSQMYQDYKKTLSKNDYCGHWEEYIPQESDDYECVDEQ